MAQCLLAVLSACGAQPGRIGFLRADPTADGRGWTAPAVATAAPRVVDAAAASPDAATTTTAGQEPVGAVPDVQPPREGAPGNDPAMARDVASVEDRVAELAHEERWDEAFAALAAAPGAADDVRLWALRAELLRDVGRRHEALALWRSIVAKAGVARVDSASLFQVAVLERMEGERERAMRTLDELQRRDAADAWLALRRDDVRRLHAAIANGTPIASVSARDLLGNLRGAPEPEERLRALAALLQTAAGDPDATATLHRRAALVAVGDDDPRVRAAGVAACAAADVFDEAFCAEALRDGSALVRVAAIRHVRLLAREKAETVLLAALARETEATVCAALHAALAEVSGVTDVAAPLAGAGRVDRAAHVARWRERLAPVAREPGR
jgi:hypothetical protein